MFGRTSQMLNFKDVCIYSQKQTSHSPAWFIHVLKKQGGASSLQCDKLVQSSTEENGDKAFCNREKSVMKNQCIRS